MTTFLNSRVARQLNSSSRAGDAIEIGIAGSLDEVRADWAALETRTFPSVFQRLFWCDAWIAAAARTNCTVLPRIIHVMQNKRLIFLWPLCLTQSALGRVLHTLGEPASQYCNALIDPDINIDFLASHVWDAILSCTGSDVLEFRRVPAGSVIERLIQLSPVKPVVLNRTIAPALDFTSPNGLRKRSARTYQALRKHERSLATGCTVSMSVARDTVSKRQLIAKALEFKHAWIRARGLWSSGYFHPANPAFLAELVHQPGFIVAALFMSQHPIAIEAGYLAGGRYWSLIQSYDEEFSTQSPGRLLLWHFIDWCSEHEIACIDFLAPSMPQKCEWANREMPVCDYLLTVTWKGHFSGIFRTYCRPLLKTLYARFPAGPKRFILAHLGRDRSRLP